MTAGLFVYGSLQPGKENAFRLERIGGQWLEGSIRGTLLDRGWGAGIGFPALLLDEGGQEVRGYLFQSDGLEAAWPELDEFEGADYRRVPATVSLSNGESVEAFVYELRQA
ncbi:MAG: gamma-glutamylcyclotransferase [Woeseiaceae bacterium]|nr:gamma-glutamylcyclotransferase [Woeseiaceae bacterium]